MIPLPDSPSQLELPLRAAAAIVLWYALPAFLLALVVRAPALARSAVAWSRVLRRPRLPLRPLLRAVGPRAFLARLATDALIERDRLCREIIDRTPARRLAAARRRRDRAPLFRR